MAKGKETKTTASSMSNSGDGASNGSSNVSSDAKTRSMPDRTAPSSSPLYVLWIDIARYSPRVQFAALSVLVFVFFLVNGLFEEYLFGVLPGFTYGWFMTFFEVTCFALFGMLERTLRPDPEAAAAAAASATTAASCFAHHAPIRRHAMVGLAMAASRGLTNVSLQYLNYPTQVVFKSMKLITVMLGSLFVLKKSFTAMECISSLALVASAISFSFGDSTVSAAAAVAATAAASTTASNTTSSPLATFLSTHLPPSILSLASPLLALLPRLSSLAWNPFDWSFDWGSNSAIGIVVVAFSLIADAWHATSQEMLVREHRATPLETMIFTNIFASLVTLTMTIVQGELWPGLVYILVDQPIALPLFIVRAVVVYLGVLTILLLYKVCGAFVATTVTVVRRVLTIILSFCLFPKSWNSFYAQGFLLFCASLGLSVIDARFKSQNPSQQQAQPAQSQPQPAQPRQAQLQPQQSQRKPSSKQH